MTTFVTGGTGFIGRHLVRTLERRGEHVRVFLGEPSTMRSEIGASVEFVLGDLEDPESLRTAMKGCTRVYHLEGHTRCWSRDPLAYHRLHVESLRTILGVARAVGVRKVVVTSTAMTFGPSGHQIIDESTVRHAPILTEYERSQLAEEAEVERYVKEGLDAVIVNPTRVFGPGELNEANSATRMIKMYVEGKWRILPGNGSAVANYAYIGDVVAGHLVAMERGRAGERYLLGGENHSYTDFFRTIDTLTGRRRFLIPVPAPIAKTVAHVDEWRVSLVGGSPAFVPGWTKTLLLDSAYSSAKAERELYYIITPFETALRMTLHWLQYRRRNGGEEIPWHASDGSVSRSS